MLPASNGTHEFCDYTTSVFCLVVVFFLLLSAKENSCNDGNNSNHTTTNLNLLFNGAENACLSNYSYNYGMSPTKLGGL